MHRGLIHSAPASTKTLSDCFEAEMNSAMQALIVGSSPLAASHLKQRLSVAGVEVEPIVVNSLDSAVETLARKPVHPDMVFVRCEGASNYDRGMIASLKNLTLATIVAVGESVETRHVLSLIRAGAADYLHTNEGFDDELQAILHRLKAKSQQQSGQGNLVSVVSTSGGCGASSVAINLAASLAKRHLTTSLVSG